MPGSVSACIITESAPGSLPDTLGTRDPGVADLLLKSDSQFAAPLRTGYPTLIILGMALGSRLPLLIHKHVFVAAMCVRAFQFYELEAFFAIELKDIAGGGYFEWVASNPVNDISPG